MSRIDTLKQFLSDDPNDSFSRYALGLEYIKSEQLDEARREFETLVQNDPAYLATYFQLGQLYQKLSLRHEAETAYRSGIAVAGSAGDSHTQSELSAALEMLLMES